MVRLSCNCIGGITGREAISYRNLLCTIRARKAVIFGSGGFTFDPELHFQRSPILADELWRIGAKLGNMAGAFRAQIVLERGLDKAFPANALYIAGDSVILVARTVSLLFDIA